MRIDLECSCGSRAEIESDDDNHDDAIVFIMHRFANAHVRCGFLTSGSTDNQQITGSSLHPSNFVEDSHDPDEL